MSYAGETLVDELKNTGITVAYGIDKRPANVDKIEIIGFFIEISSIF